jgi:hypothetical protein
MKNTIGWEAKFAAACYIDGDDPIEKQKVVKPYSVANVRDGKRETLPASLECGRVHQCDFIVGCEVFEEDPDYGGCLIGVQRVVAEDCPPPPPPPSGCKNETLDLTVEKKFLASDQVNGTAPPPNFYEACAIASQPGNVALDGQNVFAFSANEKTCQPFRFDCGESHVFTAATECRNDQKSIWTDPCPCDLPIECDFGFERNEDTCKCEPLTICHISNGGGPTPECDWNLQEQPKKFNPGHGMHMNPAKQCPPDYFPAPGAACETNGSYYDSNPHSCMLACEPIE